MTYQSPFAKVLYELSQIDKKQIGFAASEIEHWFKKHNIDLVLLPPVTEKPKPAEKKTTPKVKRKDRQQSIFKGM